MSGKSIRLFLVDGTPSGLLVAEVSNWTGKVLVAPRTELSDLARRDDARSTGIYMLVGEDPEASDRTRVYIGEADDVGSRIVQHSRKEARDFWGRAIAVVSKDENLTKAHARYLESFFIQLTRASGRAALDNATSPDLPSLPEADRADMEAFIEQVQIVLPALGIRFTMPVPPTDIPDDVESPVRRSPVFSTSWQSVRATAQVIEGEFVVSRGSTARKDPVPSLRSYLGLRMALIKAQKLIGNSDGQSLKFAEDVAFGSPSAAATTVLGRNANGRLEWKIESTGQTYHDWEQSKLEAET